MPKIELERWDGTKFKYVLRGNFVSIYMSRAELDKLHADIAKILWEDDALDRVGRIEN